MKSIRMKDCIDRSYASAPLFRAVIRQHSDWEEFLDCVNDIANYGASGGVSGFICYSDTIAFTHKHKKDILYLIKSHAVDFGMDYLKLFESMLKGYDINTMDIVGWMNGFKQDDDIDTVISNQLSWYALETVAQDVQSYIESQEA